MKQIRINVDKLLEKHNLTQQEFAEKVDIRQAAISQYARNFRSRVDIEHIQKIAEAFNINDMNEIISIEESEE